MKKHIIPFLAALFLLAGCYDLNLAPYDKLSSATFWKTEAQCKQGLMGVYASMKSLDLYGKQFLIDINSDIATGYDEYAALQTGDCTPNTKFLNGKWQNGYNTVQRANLAIRSINIAPIDNAIKNKMLGEAYFLRALIYFHLLDYFGGLPLYDESVDLEKDFNNLLKPRSTAEETRAFILADLDKALNMGLPEKWDAPNSGRVTLTAVQALMGKVYLYDKNYTKAIEYLELSKKGHELYKTYGDLFNVSAGNTSSEMIFIIMNKGGTSTPFGMPLARFAGNRCTFDWGGWNNTVPSPNLISMYEYKDGRPFHWDEVIPGFTTSQQVKQDAFTCTFADDEKTILETPEVAETLKAMYAKRDPRMMTSIIMPYTDYRGWKPNAEKKVTFILGKKKSTGKVFTLKLDNGFMFNNKGVWETYFWRKFVPEGNWGGAITDRDNTPVNWPIIRLADVYLMLAECYNEQPGGQEKAVEYINLVRTRAGIATLNSGPEWLNANTKEEVFQRIFKERAIELAGEGIRDSDLRRWRLSHKLLNGDEYGMTGKVLLTRIFRESRDYLWPIPASEIDTNPMLEQNPGWK